ncbi:microviridin/marinostatin family tricyclic proteinase inhibitor [Nostoc sp.]
MSSNLNTQTVPFFARFLVEEKPPEKPNDNPPPIYTFKYPSDWEDR